MSWQKERYIQLMCEIEYECKCCMSWQKERYIQLVDMGADTTTAACHGKKKGTSNHGHTVLSAAVAACHGKKKGTSNWSVFLRTIQSAACHGKKKEL